MRLRWMLCVTLLLPAMAAADVVKARLEWAHTVDMRFFEDGVVKNVPVLEGQLVGQGDVLAALDPRDFELARTEADAAVRHAEAADARAQRQLGWTQELYDRGLISDNERLEAEENAASAQADLDVARARLDKAQIALDRSTLKAPYDGVITGLQTWPGQVVVKQLQKDPLVEIADGRRMVARARLTSDRIRTLHAGEPAQVRTEGMEWRKGYVYRLGVESEDIIDRGAVYAVDVIFPVAPDEGFRPGQSAFVQLGP